MGVQRFGTFLSGMIMPNLAAFIAWGIITALFIQTGWAPNGLVGGFTTDPNAVAPPGLVGPMILVCPGITSDDNRVPGLLVDFKQP